MKLRSEEKGCKHKYNGYQVTDKKKTPNPIQWIVARELTKESKETNQENTWWTSVDRSTKATLSTYKEEKQQKTYKVKQRRLPSKNAKLKIVSEKTK